MSKVKTGENVFDVSEALEVLDTIFYFVFEQY